MVLLLKGARGLKGHMLRAVLVLVLVHTMVRGGRVRTEIGMGVDIKADMEAVAEVPVMGGDGLRRQ